MPNVTDIQHIALITGGTSGLGLEAAVGLAKHGMRVLLIGRAEYYPFWQEQFPEMELPWGMFGENLTVEGLLDETVHIGDRFQVGSAHVVVTQPRLPCYKLGLKFGRNDILKRFLQSKLTGFYFAVLKEGQVAA